MPAKSKPETEQPEQVPALEEALIIFRTKDDFEGSQRNFKDKVVLRDSSRMAIVAEHSTIINKHTGEEHHNAVKLLKSEKFSKSNGGGYSTKVPDAIWIDDDGVDEIGKLRDFLNVVRGGLPEEEGKYLVARVEKGEGHAEALLKLLSLAPSTDRAEALVKSIEAVSSDPAALKRLATFAAESPHATEIASAALNIAKYRIALRHLKKLIEDDAREQEFQAHLQKNHWLFGSDYSEHLDSRRLTRDEIQDFVVRRTTDNYIEILEIKTTLGDQPLFRYDESHKSYYPSRDLAKVLGQVVKYIDKLDADRHRLFFEDGLDVNKIRARIFIGRDGSDGEQEALRNHNGHLHRIEIVTFDQLAKIGQNIVDRLESVIEKSSTIRSDDGVDGIPF